jgi:hypothetical protein
MTERKRKTVADFPQFAVTLMHQGQADARGYIDFELEGKFDRIIARNEVGWLWLLLGERDCICVQWKSRDDQTLTAVLTGSEKNVPDLVGSTLYYLSPHWQAFNVWMVLDPQWGWQRVRFEASDALAENSESESISIVDGREVKAWTKVERADKKGHTTRYYPVSGGTESGSRFVPTGWDHEHCELCRTHINPGDFGYRGPDDRWMCETCYIKYVEPRDLSFVDEL